MSQLGKDQTKLTIKNIRIELEQLFNLIAKKECIVTFTDGSSPTTNYNCPKVALKDFNESKINKKMAQTGFIPQQFDFALEGYFNEGVLSQDEGDLAKVHWRLHPIDRKNIHIEAEAIVESQMSLKGPQVTPEKIDLLIETSSFQKIVKSFSDTALAIPAPFNSLDGKIKIQINDVKGEKNILKIKGNGLTRLSGPGEQKLNLNFEGDFNYPLQASQSKQKLDVRLEILDAFFHLPPFDPLAGVPPLQKDPRIITKKDKKASIPPKPEKSISKKSSMDLNVVVQSKRNDSVRLYYKLFKPYLGFGINVRLNPEGTFFTLTAKDDFTIDYLKRQVQVQKILLKQSKKSAPKIPVDVRLLYQASGYDIFIDVIGTIDRPQVQLSSKPSVPREDIISLLLYNRTRSDLSSFQSENVGGVESAITDRALGLFGIWAFASTPIESVSYDSRNQVYRAQIALPQGIKFDIGTDWEKTRVVGLRKRISENWTVTTGYQSNEDERDTGNMFLQREFTF